MNALTLRVMPWTLSVCKLVAPGLPIWATGSVFLNYAVTGDEVSLVCESALVPEGLTSETGFVALKVDGVLDFSLVGIAAKLTTVMARCQISVLVLSTFDTDYVLLRRERLEEAVAALGADGYTIVQ
jgi:uncharacterized protein